MTPFAETLSLSGLTLFREAPETLVVNVGSFCNQACSHCHHHAGPGETDVMTLETAALVADFAQRGGFSTLDLTGGAPEFSEAAVFLMESLKGRCGITFRTNLTALASMASKVTPGYLAERKIRLIASFPSPDREEFEAQRGRRTFDLALSAMRKLNELGYGVPGSGLNLDLAANPLGPELPEDQNRLAEMFRKRLSGDHGLVFNGLFAFANMPLGRFRERLGREGLRESYMEMLEKAFCADTVKGLMCLKSLCVDHRGILYDCDFNLAANIPLSGREIRVTDFSAPFGEGLPVETDDHCYACTAGAGFT